MPIRRRRRPADDPVAAAVSPFARAKSLSEPYSRSERDLKEMEGPRLRRERHDGIGGFACRRLKIRRRKAVPGERIRALLCSVFFTLRFPAREAPSA